MTMSPATIGWLAVLSQGAFWLIVAGLVFSCLTDLRYRIVCNEISIVVLLAAIALALGHGTPASSDWMAFGAIAVTVLALTLTGVMGGGDVKLIIALMPSLSAWGCLQFVVATCLAGGVIGLLAVVASLILRRWPAAAAPAPAVARTRPLRRWLRHERARLRRGRSIPYVPAITIGWLAAVNG